MVGLTRSVGGESIKNRSGLRCFGILTAMNSNLEVNLNGVDLEAVREITERYRNAPSTRESFAASVEWIGGYRTESRLGPAEGFRGDEPEELAGTNTGPSPEDMLLGALGQCLIVGLAGAASSRGIELRSLSIEASGEVNLPAAYGVGEGHPGFHRVNLKVHVDSSAERAELDALLSDALAHAPIPNTVMNPVEVVAELA